jgi:NAD(P)H-nitrite reductase large subunit
MPEYAYRYVIVGGGLAGASACVGIREIDAQGAVALIGAESYLPYNRPPLSKDLWRTSEPVENIVVHSAAFYETNNIDLVLGTRVVELDPARNIVADDEGNSYRFEKLLLATGGIPRALSIPGGDLEGLCYYRTLDDYVRIRRTVRQGGSAVIIGGGFSGAELAASLADNRARVTMVFPDDYLCSQVLPSGFGNAVQDTFRRRGASVLNDDRPISIIKEGERFITYTQKDRRLESEAVIVAAEANPSIRIAVDASLAVTPDGVVVNEYLQTSAPDIFAAGDNALFPYPVLGRLLHVEHWDNALHQGRLAGRNMAGTHEPYTHISEFDSSFFQYSLEAVGNIDSLLRIIPNWTVEYEKGILYYLNNDQLEGVLMCNMPGRTGEARELIRRGTLPDDMYVTVRR